MPAGKYASLYLNIVTLRRSFSWELPRMHEMLKEEVYAYIRRWQRQDVTEPSCLRLLPDEDTRLQAYVKAEAAQNLFDLTAHCIERCIGCIIDEDPNFLFPDEYQDDSTKIAITATYGITTRALKHFEKLYEELRRVERLISDHRDVISPPQCEELQVKSAKMWIELEYMQLRYHFPTDLYSLFNWSLLVKGWPSNKLSWSVDQRVYETLNYKDTAEEDWREFWMEQQGLKKLASAPHETRKFRPPVYVPRIREEGKMFAAYPAEPEPQSEPKAQYKPQPRRKPRKRAGRQVRERAQIDRESFAGSTSYGHRGSHIHHAIHNRHN